MSVNLLNNLIEQAKSAFIQCHEINTLELVRIKFLGRNGYINQHIKTLNSIELHAKPKLGAAINQAKQDIHKLFIKYKKKLESKIIEKSLHTNFLDITLPGRSSEIGTIHPITNTIDRAKKFFDHLGFQTIHGPEIEDDYFNFDALNIPMNHPSRAEHDTFWFDPKRLLRTHTSGIQIRAMLNATLPIRVISIGRVYRKDYDKKHTPMFHQMEGLIIDSDINFGNLKKILYDFLYNFFITKIILRFRPSYFPFTEPSAEIDILKITKQLNKQYWLELLGCGMIHPRVLHNAGIDSKKITGLAFGIGIERLAMLLYHITDIRIFFENDLQFLNQFK